MEHEVRYNILVSDVREIGTVSLRLGQRILR